MLKHVRQLNGSSEASRIPDELIIDDNLYNSPIDIVNKLNYYFANISDRLKASTTSSSTSDRVLHKLNDFVKKRIPENTLFRIPLINISSLTNAIQSLDISKATGLSGLSPKILKLSADVVAPTLVQIKDLSIQKGQFPDILKVAKLFPIHKDCAKHDP